MVVEVPIVHGLSFSVDYYEIEVRDRASASFQAILSGFPERVTRAAPSAEDIAAGRPGRVTRIDRRFVNVAYLEKAGFDYELRYRNNRLKGGSIDLRLLVTKPTTSIIAIAPGQAQFDDKPALPWRGTGQLFLGYNAWSIGAIATYSSSYQQSYQPGFAGRSIASVLLWDFQVSYDFPSNPIGRQEAGKRLLEGLKVSVNIINAFNKEPQVVAGNAVNASDIDPRGRRYSVSISKHF